MPHDRTRANAAILARHLATSGKYRDIIAIEADLFLKGRGDLILLLDDPALRGELNALCIRAAQSLKKSSNSR